MGIWLALIVLTGLVIYIKFNDKLTPEEDARIMESLRYRSENNFLLNTTESWWGKE